MFKKTIFIFIFMLLCLFQIKAGEIEFGWNLSNESGKINDMEFMPDNNYFILATDVDIQIRNTETGEEVKNYAFGAKEIEFTPDSSKLILSIQSGDSVATIQVRNLEDMSLINEYKTPIGIDTDGLDIIKSYVTMQSLIVDPIRTYIYVIRTRQGYLSGGIKFWRTKIIVYDYNKMSEVKELAVVSSEIEESYEYLDISKDGRYLASISSGKSKISVWDLDNYELINNHDICNSTYNDDAWGTATCIKFSELNPDNIYYSGDFDYWEDDDLHNGLFIYSINDNIIVDSTFGVGELHVCKGYFSFFNNENKIVKTGSGFIYIIDIENTQIDLALYINGIDYRLRWDKKIMYSSVMSIYLCKNKKVSLQKFLFLKLKK